jgi:AcrR family transcriptional regulator
LEVWVSTLRELKKQRTREAIQREALRLIEIQGYAATTCEQIAGAAEVSPATLFRYFPTKEDIVLHDVYDPMIADAVRDRPASETPLTALRRALAKTLDGVYETDLEQVRQRTALILSIPALRARSQEQNQSLVRHLTRALAERTGADPGDARIQVEAAVCAAALGVAVERWAQAGGDLRDHVDQAMAAVASMVGGSQ